MQLPDTSLSHNVSIIAFGRLLRNLVIIKNAITISVCTDLVRMENAFCILRDIQKSRFLRKQILDAITSSPHSLGRFLFLIHLLKSSIFLCVV